mmetsp:Transcript_20193/g.17359  ORF Transcript_20193/g.17359 Transcript_20193/m.17359 type:complete len:351 (+) Transcript_20193:48-1100(+)
MNKTLFICFAIFAVAFVPASAKRTLTTPEKVQKVDEVLVNATAADKLDEIFRTYDRQSVALAFLNIGHVLNKAAHIAEKATKVAVTVGKIAAVAGSFVVENPEEVPENNIEYRLHLGKIFDKIVHAADGASQIANDVGRIVDVAGQITGRQTVAFFSFNDALDKVGHAVDKVSDVADKVGNIADQVGKVAHDISDITGHNTQFFHIGHIADNLAHYAGDAQKIANAAQKVANVAGKIADVASKFGSKSEGLDAGLGLEFINIGSVMIDKKPIDITDIKKKAAKIDKIATKIGDLFKDYEPQEVATAFFRVGKELIKPECIDNEKMYHLFGERHEEGAICLYSIGSALHQA